RAADHRGPPLFPYTTLFRSKMIEFDPDGRVFAVHDLDKAAGLELPRQAEDTLSNPVDYFEYVDDVMCYYVVGDHVVHKYRHDGVDRQSTRLNSSRVKISYAG